MGRRRLVGLTEGLACHGAHRAFCVSPSLRLRIVSLGLVTAKVEGRRPGPIWERQQDRNAHELIRAAYTRSFDSVKHERPEQKRLRQISC
jgi:hypothetical protein